MLIRCIYDGDEYLINTDRITHATFVRCHEDYARRDVVRIWFGGDRLDLSGPVAARLWIVLCEAASAVVSADGVVRQVGTMEVSDERGRSNHHQR